MWSTQTTAQPALRGLSQIQIHYIFMIMSFFQFPTAQSICLPKASVYQLPFSQSFCPKYKKCLSSVISAMSENNFQAKMNSNLYSLVIACSLWQLRLFIHSVEKRHLELFCHVSWISDEQATMVRLIKPWLVLGSSGPLASLLPTSHPAELHRAVLIVNITNLFRNTSSYFSISTVVC